MDTELFITLFSDASHCPNSKACGWAVWIKYGHPARTERLFGRQANVATSNAAELLALQQGLAYVENHIPYQGKVIVMQSDCKGALDKIASQAQQMKDNGAKHVKLKWVKGHNGRKDSRSAVNSWCDETARNEMRSLRDSSF